jgi:hypothetical protein
MSNGRLQDYTGDILPQATLLLIRMCSSVAAGLAASVSISQCRCWVAKTCSSWVSLTSSLHMGHLLSAARMRMNWAAPHGNLQDGHSDQSASCMRLPVNQEEGS